ncbi:cutinase [Flagelloscypha sp. PMI_526]|nr:cutinase [Flagelloscypha sp. PMI_526]
MFKFTLFTLAGSFFTTLVLAGPIPLHLRQAGNCADVTTIFARGTTEIPDIGTVTLDFQGVDYPANVAGFLQGGDADGSATMAKQVTDALAAYSDSMGSIAKALNSSITLQNFSLLPKPASVAAVAMFGDPDNGDALGNGLDAKALTICRNGDNICDGGALILPPHLAYGADTGDAADFIAGKV